MNAAVGAANPLQSALQQVNVALTQSTAVTGRNAAAQQQALVAYNELIEANRLLHQVAGKVDDYKKQEQAVAASRDEYKRLRDEMRQAAAAIQASNAPTAAQVAHLQRLGQEVVQARAAYQQNASTLRQMGGALREAGVDTQRLAQEEQRIIQMARQASSEIRRLSGDYDANAQAARRAAAATEGVGNSSRTALSFAQRLRGEILALTSAFVGLYGAANFTKQVLDASAQTMAMKVQFEVVADGDTAVAGEMEKYLRGQADRMGLDLKSTSKAYADFAISAKTAGMSQQSVNYIFERFGEAGVVLNKTAADMDGIYKALSQMFSKGSIQAEELKQQLGDRMPAVFATMAKSMNITTTQLMDMMQQGKVGSENLILLAQAIEQQYGNAFEKMKTGMVAESNRAKTAYFDWLALIGQNGVAEAFAKLMRKITAFFKSDEGTKWAESIAEAIVMVIEALSWCVDNIDTLAEVIKVLIAIQLGVWIAHGITALIALKGAAIVAAGAMANLAKTAPLITKAFGALTVFFIGWEIGKILYDKFKIVRQAAAWMVKGVLQLFNEMGANIQVVLNVLPKVAAGVGLAIANALLYPIRQALKSISAGASFFGMDEAAAQAAKFAKQLDLAAQASAKFNAGAVEFVKIRNATIDEAARIGNDVDAAALAEENARNEAYLAKLKKDTAEATKTQIDAEKELAAAREKAGKAGDDEKKKKEKKEAAPKKTEEEKLAEKLEKARIKAIEDREKREIALMKKLDDLEAARLGKSLTSLDDRIKAVKMKYKEIYDEIEELSKKNYVTVEEVESRRTGGGGSGRGGYSGRGSGLKYQGGVNKSKVSEGVFAIAELAADITGNKFAVSSMRRGSANSRHSQGLAFDMAMPANKDATAALRELIATMESFGYKQGKDFFAQIERKGQKNKNGSVATGDHMHVEIKGQQIAASIADSLRRTPLDAPTTQVGNAVAQTTTKAGMTVDGSAPEWIAMQKERTRLDEEAAIAQVTREYALDVIKKKEEDVNKLLEDRNNRIKIAEDMQANGLMTEAQKRTEVQAIMAETTPLITEAANSTVAMAETLEGLDPTRLNEVKVAMAEIKQKAQFTPEELAFIQGTNEAMGTMFETFFTTAATGLGEILAGTKSVKDGFNDMLRGFAQAAGQFLIKMGQMIIQALLFKAIASAMGFDTTMSMSTSFADFVGMIGGKVKHSGGMIDSIGGRSRNVPMSIFAGAERYHTGGVIGLKPNEVPIVAERGEEMLTADDPRHVNNLGSGGGSGGGSAPANIKIVNTIDPREVVNQALSDPDVTTSLVKVISDNQTAFNTALGKG